MKRIVFLIWILIFIAYAAPTSDNGSVVTNEDTDLVFNAGDFPITGGTLNSIKIVNLPTRGSLYLDENGDNNIDFTESVSVNQVISSDDITKLKFEPEPQKYAVPYTSFLFKVNDGIDFSELAYAMFISVNPVNNQPENTVPPSIATELQIRIGGTVSANTGVWNDDTDNPENSVTVNPNELGFGNVVIDESKELVFAITGNDLTTDVTVTAPNGFQVSKTSGSGFSSSVNYTPSSGGVSGMVFVKFNPTEVKAYNYNLSVASTGAEIQYVAVTGTGMAKSMNLVQGGTFQMGDEVGDLGSACLPIHQVTLSSFYIGKYEITQAEWETVMTGNSNGISANPSNFTGSNKPVEQVSWYDILVFCNRKSIQEGLTPVYSISSSTNPDNWGSVPTNSSSTWDAVICEWTGNGYRLPTEAEWEYAARGGKDSFGYSYAGSNDIDTVAWYDTNSGNTTHPVGCKTPNELGLYDMSGNVWEWNWDCYINYTEDPQTNPFGQITGSNRVLRGGNFCYSAITSRVALRDVRSPTSKIGNLGFRLARSIVE
ncbi:MAG: SUMF1/EgtB/PvdO family nonheme iron enzyme [Candidatus Delongbacteria bacterium]|nr:SUMF1/EgtB/PvdO family nonheme iron enzyme [Candidatus Delongbacteria bacterium]MBN2835545.1 SUMF1/EgtB/PvdO family nonheme iron enzyme [Candidatus Delongbacteria bacterium]